MKKNKIDIECKKHVRTIRGMHDFSPEEMYQFRLIEKTLKNILINYGYQEIQFPIIENTMLFKKTIGEINDIVKKEMYTFLDKKGRSLTLRPEGTACCVRLLINRNFIKHKEQRFWYTGPMFRYERPQKIRYRQFHQVGIETFGNIGPNIDIELILLSSRWWKKLGIDNHTTLEVNSLGSISTRQQYRKDLIKFFLKNKLKLTESHFNQIHTNPIRILDSKDTNIKDLIKQAPILIDYLDEDSKKHFRNFCNLLKNVGISYVFNPYLVRGLDYYNRTVFEWITKINNIQISICGGGHYDELVEKICGKSVPAVGLSTGIERLIFFTKEINPNFFSMKRLDIYLIILNSFSQKEAFLLSEEIRNLYPKLKIKIHLTNGNLKKQIIFAKKFNSRIVLILGSRKTEKSKIIIKNLDTGFQEILSKEKTIDKINFLFNQKNFHSIRSC